MNKCNKMTKNKNAFSLIEIIVATGILSLTVFGIYKLIWENNKIITNSNNFLSQNFIMQNSYECTKWQNFSGSKFLDFWDDLKSCNFSDNEKFVKIDNIDYLIKIETENQKWKISVNSWVLKDDLIKFFEK